MTYVQATKRGDSGGRTAVVPSRLPRRRKGPRPGRGRRPGRPGPPQRFKRRDRWGNFPGVLATIGLGGSYFYLIDTAPNGGMATWPVPCKGPATTLIAS